MGQLSKQKTLHILIKLVVLSKASLFVKSYSKRTVHTQDKQRQIVAFQKSEMAPCYTFAFTICYREATSSYSSGSTTPLTCWCSAPSVALYSELTITNE